jgi:hypothetical protein
VLDALAKVSIVLFVMNNSPMDYDDISHFSVSEQARIIRGRIQGLIHARNRISELASAEKDYSKKRELFKVNDELHEVCQEVLKQFDLIKR